MTCTQQDLTKLQPHMALQTVMFAGKTPVTAPVEEKPHPYARCVNPYLAEMLSKLWLDKRFVRGEGSELIDDKGRRYLDAVAAYGALPFGFNPKEIWEGLMDVQLRAEPSFVQPSLL